MIKNVYYSFLCLIPLKSTQAAKSPTLQICTIHDVPFPMLWACVAYPTVGFFIIRPGEKPTSLLETVVVDTYWWIQFHRYPCRMTTYLRGYSLCTACWLILHSRFSWLQRLGKNKVRDSNHRPPDRQADVLTTRPRRPPPLILMFIAIKNLIFVIKGLEIASHLNTFFLRNQKC